MLDPIQQRIVGVLFEKELTVPDSYPLTENSLISGCNQKSNRDPEMELDSTEIHPALLKLREDGWIARVEGSGRTVRYRHRLLDRLNVSRDEAIVMTELLLRGPQSPGALKPRIARMGLQAEPQQILAILEGLAAHQPTPLVEILPRYPRERDHRWGQTVGPRPQATPIASDDASDDASDVSTAATPARATRPSGAEFADRIARLEADVRDLRQIVDQLRGI